MRCFFLGICMLTGVVSCVHQDLKSKDIQPGDRIPAFQIVMEDDSSLSSKELSGSPALLLFFHTSCPDCQRTIPVVQAVYEEFGKEARFVAISRAQEARDIRSWWDAHGITLPFSAQQDSKIYNLFASSRIPRVYVIDRNGVIQAAYDDNPCPSYGDLAQDFHKIFQ